MYKLGLTGSIATGKSTVSSFLREQGIHVIDADAVAHELLESDTELLTALKETFGADIFINNQLSRPMLGKKVFGNPAALEKLNNVTHPRIYQRIDELAQVAADSGADLLVYDIPLLLETPSKMSFDGIMVVSTTPAHQLERLMNRNNLSEDDAKKRITSQMPLAEKEQLADFIINNDGEMNDTYNQVKAVLTQILP